MSIEAASLRGKYMQEVYDTVCKNPDGVTAGDVKQICPHIPPERVGATLKKLKDLGLVRAERINTSAATHRWFRN